jgi:hypothetical protein
VDGSTDAEQPKADVEDEPHFSEDELEDELLLVPAATSKSHRKGGTCLLVWETASPLMSSFVDVQTAKARKNKKQALAESNTGDFALLLLPDTRTVLTLRSDDASDVRPKVAKRKRRESTPKIQADEGVISCCLAGRG